VTNRTRGGHGPIGFNTSFIFASQAAGSLLRAVYAAVLARKLGPEYFGLMNYGLGWYATFLAVANLQLESYMSRQIALHPTDTLEVLSRTMTLRTVSTSLAFLLAAVAAVAAGDSGLLTGVLLIYAVAMAGRSAAMWCSSAFVSRENARHALGIEVSFRAAEVVIGISALLLGFGLIAVALIHALSWWAQAAYGLLLVRTHLADVRLRFRASRLPGLLRTVLPVAIASIASAWLMQGPFVLFKDKAAVAGDLGQVALVLQIFVLATGIPVALGRAALPALSRTVARTDNKDALFLSLFLRIAIFGTTLLALVAAAAGPRLIPLIFGQAFHSAGAHLVFGIMLVLPFGIGSIATQILVAHDKPWHAMAAATAGAAAMTAAVMLFMPVGGSFTGYFLCILAGMVIWSLSALILLSRWVDVQWLRLVAKPALVSGLSLAAYGMLAGTVGTASGLALAIATLMAGQWIFHILSEPERGFLLQILRSGKGR
jgi:O-antigen/teichoic acid export membrane protein